MSNIIGYFDKLSPQHKFIFKKIMKIININNKKFIFLLFLFLKYYFYPILDQYNLNKKFKFEDLDKEKTEWFKMRFNSIIERKVLNKKINHEMLSTFSCDAYEQGYSCLDLIDFIKANDKWSNLEISNIELCFHKVKSEFRCEKLLMLYMLDLIFADKIHIPSRI